MSTHKLAKRFGGWVAWSSGVTGTASVVTHLLPRGQVMIRSIPVEASVYKLVSLMAVL